MEQQNKRSRRKAIFSYYFLSLLLTLPLLTPLWLINDPLGVIGYFLCFLIYVRIAVSLAVRATVMPSLWRELDAEKYASIINAKPFLVHYSYQLSLCFAVGNYQAAHNIISSVLLPHKNLQQRIYGHLLLCRVCFERGDYEGLKEHLAEIDRHFHQNSSIKLPKQNQEAYKFYRAFSDSDYLSVCSLLEKSIANDSKKKNGAYFALMRQYQLAVTQRRMGRVEEATALLESIEKKAPNLILSTLARKQLKIISGEAEEAPERLSVTEIYPSRSHRHTKILLLISIVAIGVYCLLTILGKLLAQSDLPRQKDKDLAYIASLEGAIADDYEEFQILGYFDIYTDYANEAYSMRVDSLFLVESNGRLDLHTPYLLNGEYMNLLNAQDLQVNRLYEYEIHFSPQKVEFILTEKERDIPQNTLYYYETDGYYFCVISISDI